MAKDNTLLLSQYNDIRAQMENVQKQASITASGLLITAKKDLLPALTGLRANMIPNEEAYNQIGYVLTVLENVSSYMETSSATPTSDGVMLDTDIQAP